MAGNEVKKWSISGVPAELIDSKLIGEK